jgi:hypothetical protein
VMMEPFLPLRNWVNAAGLLLMLSANGCATSTAPQVPGPPSGQARIWFYRLWDPSESRNVANIGVNGVYVGSVEPGGAFYRDVAPGQTNLPRSFHRALRAVRRLQPRTMPVWIGALPSPF